MKNTVFHFCNIKTICKFSPIWCYNMLQRGTVCQHHCVPIVLHHCTVKCHTTSVHEKSQNNFFNNLILCISSVLNREIDSLIIIQVVNLGSCCFSAKISKFNCHSLNSETRGAELKSNSTFTNVC